MTTIVFACPKCQAKYKTKQTLSPERIVTCQKCNAEFCPAQQVLPAVPSTESKLSEVDQSVPAPTFPAAAVPVSAPVSTEVPLFVADDDRASAVLQKVTGGKAKAKPSSPGRSSPKSNTMSVVLGITLAFAALVGAAYAYLGMNSPEPPTQEAMQRPVASAASPAASAVAERQATQTPRTPLTLQAMPAGLRLLINLRFSDLLTDSGPSGDALRHVLDASVGPALEHALHRPLDQIDTLLIGVLLGPVGSPPELAYRVQLKQTARPLDPSSELSATQPLPAQSNLFVHAGQAIHVRDARSYSVAPERLGAELVNFQFDPAFTDPDLEAMLKLTDTAQPLTILGKFEDLLTHAGQLVGVARADVLAWLGRTADKTADMFLVEAQFDDTFNVSAQFIPLPNVSALNVQKQFQQQMTQAPLRLVEFLRERSAMTVGQQRLAGRFPAMIEASLLSTDFALNKNVAVTQTTLPANAWPNLLLAGYSCWQSQGTILRPDLQQLASGMMTPPAIAKKDQVELTWQQRLVLPIEIDFKRTPLQDAITYIAEETKLTIDIDGDALKLSGYTKNMPQNFTLGKVPAIKVLQVIMAQYEAMCLLKGDDANTLIISTKPIAASQNKPPLDLAELAVSPLAQ